MNNIALEEFWQWLEGSPAEWAVVKVGDPRLWFARQGVPPKMTVTFEGDEKQLRAMFDSLRRICSADGQEGTDAER